jgi:23S rRNA pseudouridine955/2504/2580 synthase
MFIENNENFVVINKPAGIAVQSGTKSRRNILDILRSTEEFEGSLPYAVHRIDKETTGVFIVAKNRKYAQLFTSLFRIRKIHKTYLGVVLGLPEKNKGTLKDDLLYYENKKKIKASAITHYTVLDNNNNYSLLKLNPETGKKHQLRKQLLIHGNPVLGDTKYRISENYPSKKNTLMLHAYKINFSINGTKYNFSAEPPLTFKNILKEKYLKIF